MIVARSETQKARLNDLLNHVKQPTIEAFYLRNHKSNDLVAFDLTITLYLNGTIDLAETINILES